ncbi:EAL domain-containing protein [Bacillus benzoevorans]|uniref:EAL domain-containing protein (Putative c-di-GMP-specific phosphodiesterase class I) n=1 Tax=Bacillus benzoevorans TaxID=1456 RepID=A0A7X0LUW0_9BACI|nr:EAL-associated domain-containing protein [Bacillus benzoevorans]MBB6443669.1 EAL domain-containing protein (putative c-di-GMP-specific phosphodiesterase class I) [Bacillus benzoevorans]
MDALDILTDLDHVIPYFQPIFSADEHRIIGYEIFGRYISGGKVVSLGPFFQDSSIPDEYRLEVDNTVLTKALEQALSIEKDILLFVNRDAEVLTHNDGESFLQLLLQFQEKGISLNQIVLEIDAADPKYDEIAHLMNYYRTYGIKIAIDKMGDDSSHLDRIGQLKPDIVKVDLLPLRSMNLSPVYRDILYSLSILARKIGATLLFKNIEMVYQLQFAWQHGGRYYQGFYLGKPDEEFCVRDILKDKMKSEFHGFILYEKRRLEAVFDVSEKFQAKLQDLLSKNRKTADYEEMMNLLVKSLDDIAFRMYVCDEDGFQKTANMFKKDNEWMVQPEYYQKNWSWRPYFLENIFKMRHDKKGILSDLYRDIETGETIRTFSYPLNSQEYLFIDLSYEFLYRQEGLL